MTEIRFTRKEIGDAAKRTRKWLETKKTIPQYVRIFHDNKEFQVTMPDFLCIMASDIAQLSVNQNEPVLYRHFTYPTKPADDIIKGKIYRVEYVQIAFSVRNYMEKSGKCPDYAYQTSLGTHLGYNNLLYMFSCILDYYHSSGKIADYAVMNLWGKDAPINKDVYASPRWAHNQDQIEHSGYGYTCGPFTCTQMIYELWGVMPNHQHMVDITWEGSGGTDHNGMINGIKQWARENGHSANAYFVNFSSLGNSVDERMRKIGEMVANPNIAVGIHSLYKNHEGWGHYEYITMINMKSRVMQKIQSLNDDDVYNTGFDDEAVWIANTPYGQSSIFIAEKLS